jgi:hypothetical protein
VSHLKVFSIFYFIQHLTIVDLKVSLFKDVSKRFPADAGPRDTLILNRIISVASTGSPFNSNDIRVWYKDLPRSEVKALIKTLVDENILSDNGDRKYVFHSNLEKSYFRENPKP